MCKNQRKPVIIEIVVSTYNSASEREYNMTPFVMHHQMIENS